MDRRNVNILVYTKGTSERFLMLLNPLLVLLGLFCVSALQFDVEPPIELHLDPEALDPYLLLYSTFPPIDPLVIQCFHFTTSSPLILDLHDAFCTGNYYMVWDNFCLVLAGEDILNFCGISANNLKPIANPSFTNVQHYLPAGEHEVYVLIFHSPIGNKRTSMRITLKPVDGEDVCRVDVHRMDEKSFKVPSSEFTYKDFDIKKYVSSGYKEFS